MKSYDAMVFHRAPCRLKLRNMKFYYVGRNIRSYCAT